MRQRAEAAGTPPDTLEVYGGLDRLIAAAAARDQAAWDEAGRNRAAILARANGRSIEGRRNQYGMLDLPGTGIAALAHARRLHLTPDDGYVGTELIERWPVDA
jgi:hypothetical protein